MKKKFFFFILFFLLFILLFLIIEILLRISDKDPWSNFIIDKEEPTTNIYDDIIGWIPKEGVYKFKSLDSNKEYFTMTILKDGMRYSGEYSKNFNKVIATLGDSFTQGVAVDDKENFPFFLQNKLKSNHIKVNNYGVGGYSTYQALLKLEDIFIKKNKIDLVVYSFITSHEVRNIGDEFWLKTLTKFSKRGTVYLPYVIQNNDGSLIRKKPIAYIKLPLREKLVIINKFEKRIMKFLFFSRYKNSKEISQKLILNMKQISEKNNSKFLLVNLSEDDYVNKNYIKFLDSNKINYVDCSIKLDEKTTVKIDGHPNKKAHKSFSNCIANYIKNKKMI